jgi:hypothetical protein
VSYKVIKEENTMDRGVVLENGGKTALEESNGQNFAERGHSK